MLKLLMNQIYSIMIILNSLLCYSYGTPNMRRMKRIKRHRYPPPQRDVPTPREQTERPTSSSTSQPSSTTSNLLSSSTPTLSPSLQSSSKPVNAFLFFSTTMMPSPSPSLYSNNPSIAPSLSPVNSNRPSILPSSYISDLPTKMDSATPTSSLSQNPTIILSEDPSGQPTKSLSKFPSLSPTLTPTVIPSVITYNSCEISDDERLIGNQTLNEVLVRYKYQMNFFTNSTLTLVMDSLETDISKALVNEQGFIECANMSKNGTNLKGMRQPSFVVGINSDPIDSTSDESCPIEADISIGVSCSIFNGYLTLFLIDNPVRRLYLQNDEELTLAASTIIKDNMNSGILNSAHEAIISLEAMELNEDDGSSDDGSSDDGSSDDGSSTDGSSNDGSSDDEGSNKMNSVKAPLNQPAIDPSFAWLLVAFGGVILTGIVGIFHHPWQPRSNEGDNSHGLSSNDSLSVNQSLFMDEEDADTIKTSNILQSSEEGEISSSRYVDSSSEEEALKKPSSGDGVPLVDSQTLGFANLLDSKSGISSECDTIIVADEKGQ